MEIVVTGASGFIGSALVDALRHAGHGVRRLVRRTATASDERSWDPAAGRFDPAALAGAGRGGAPGRRGHRATTAGPTPYKKEILDSRVRSTTLLADALAAGAGPTVLLSGSRSATTATAATRSSTSPSVPAPASCRRCARRGRRRRPRLERRRARSSPAHRDRALGGGGRVRKQLPLFKVGLGGRDRQRTPVAELDHSR